MSLNIKLFIIYLTVFAVHAFGGSLSVRPWQFNADAGVSSLKKYTHTIDFGAELYNVSYDGVRFDSAANSGGMIDGDAYDFSIISDSSFGDVSNIASTLENGFSHAIVSDMIYPVDGNAVLTISGLNAGKAYRLALYSIGWENGSRASFIYGDDAGVPDLSDQSYIVDQDQYGTGNGILVYYNYIAPVSGELNLYFKSVTAGWHFYGFSNELLESAPANNSRRVSFDELLSWSFDNTDVNAYDLYLGDSYDSIFNADKYSPSDYNENGIVDLIDYSILAQVWLTSNKVADYELNGVVDIDEMAVFSSNWLAESNPDYIITTDKNYFNIDNLDLFKTYYWRIDENRGEAITKGDIQCFTVSASNSVAVGESSLISEISYSDTFTINDVRDKYHDFAWYSAYSPASVEIESSNDIIRWNSDNPSGLHIRSTNSAVSGFGNKGSLSGVLEVNNSNVSIVYNKSDSDTFIVQFDAILPSVRSGNTSGRLEISCSKQGLAFPELPDTFSVYLKKVGIFHEIGFYNSSFGEKKVMQNINVSDNEWHNYALAFNKVTKQVEIFIDETPVFDIDLHTIYDGIFTFYISDMSVGIGSDTIAVIDNVQIGELKYTRAHHPVPADGTGVNSVITLGWSGIDGPGYDLYIGKDYNTVAKAESGSECFKGRQESNSYYMSELTSGTDYYWRVDQVTENGIAKGNVWKFSTYGQFMDFGIEAPTRIYYIDCATYSNLSAHEQRLLMMLQGAVARFKPEIYICLHNDHIALLEDLKDTYGIFTTDVNSVKGSSSAVMYLLKKYKNRFDGYVLYDQESNPESILVAASLAGIYNYLPVDASLMSYMPIAGIPQALDVRDKDSQWLYDNYWDEFEHNAICIVNPEFSYFARLFDLAIASGMPLFWDEDPMFNDQLLDSLLPNGIVYGWGNPSIGSDWPDEANFVDLYSSNSACIGPIDAVSNLSVMAGMSSYQPGITFNMPNRVEEYQSEANVHYVAFLVGDMDHVLDGLHFTGSDRTYGIPERGAIPMNWQTPAYMTKLAPGSLSWFYRNATDNDYFVDFFSGIYMHPHIHSDLDEFCNQLNQMAIAADQNITVLSEAVPADYQERILWEQKVGEKYASMSAFRGYFTYPILPGNGTINWIKRKPFINHRFVLMDEDNDVIPPDFALNPEQLAEAINSLPADPASESGYSFVYIANWGHSAYENAMETVELLSSDVRIVSMEEFVERIYINKPE